MSYPRYSCCVLDVITYLSTASADTLKIDEIPTATLHPRALGSGNWIIIKDKRGRYSQSREIMFFWQIQTQDPGSRIQGLSAWPESSVSGGSESLGIIKSYAAISWVRKERRREIDLGPVPYLLSTPVDVRGKPGGSDEMKEGLSCERIIMLVVRHFSTSSILLL